MEHTITFRGVELTVTGDYQPPHFSRDYYDKPEEAYWEFGDILVGGVDIFSLLDDDAIDQIHNIVLDAHESSLNYAENEDIT